MISVCMSTYNGENFIYKQLETILNQTMTPDEVIICDDCSADGTVEIITDFIETHGLKGKWVLYCNQQNKGYPENFYHAMGLCHGEVVFLADQDDLWCGDKIEYMHSVIQNNPDILLLASRWGIIDEKDEILKNVSRGKIQNEDNCDEITVSEVFYCYDWPGMSMCYRKELGETVIKKAGNTKLAHDVAMSLISAEKGGFQCVNKVLQYHRRHTANTALEEHRVRKNLNKKRKILEIERYIKQLDDIITAEILDVQTNREMVLRKKDIMSERLENLKCKKRSRMIKQYKLHKKEIRLSTLICDWLICGQKIEDV